jgi:hypothetical protein
MFFVPSPLVSPTGTRLGGWLLAALLVAPGAQALPLISEVLYDAVGSDDGQTFVEISAAAGTSLDGFTLEGVNGSGGAIGPVITLSGTVSASGLFVVADHDSGGSTFVALFDQLANFDFQNGPDSIVLRNAAAVVIDSLGYGVFAAGDVFAGEGNSASDPSAGSSLARLFANVDTNDNALDFVALATPTPGIAEFAPVPEPGTALLVGLGLAGLGAAGGPRRRR